MNQDIIAKLFNRAKEAIERLRRIPRQKGLFNRTMTKRDVNYAIRTIRELQEIIIEEEVDKKEIEELLEEILDEAEEREEEI